MDALFGVILSFTPHAIGIVGLIVALNFRAKWPVGVALSLILLLGGAETYRYLNQQEKEAVTVYTLKRIDERMTGRDHYGYLRADLGVDGDSHGSFPMIFDGTGVLYEVRIHTSPRSFMATPPLRNINTELVDHLDGLPVAEVASRILPYLLGITVSK